MINTSLKPLFNLGFPLKLKTIFSRQFSSLRALALLFTAILRMPMCTAFPSRVVRNPYSVTAVSEHANEMLTVLRFYEVQHILNTRCLCIQPLSSCCSRATGFRDKNSLRWWRPVRFIKGNENPRYYIERFLFIIFIFFSFFRAKLSRRILPSDYCCRCFRLHEYFKHKN